MDVMLANEQNLVVSLYLSLSHYLISHTPAIVPLDDFVFPVYSDAD